MGKATIIRKDPVPGVDGERWQRWLVELDGKHYVISNSRRPGRPAALAFLADENGEIADWTDLAAGKGLTHGQVIAQLEAEVERGEPGDTPCRAQAPPRRREESGATVEDSSMGYREEAFCFLWEGR